MAVDNKDELEKKPTDNEGNLNFFQMIWAVLSGQSDPNWERRRLLKEVAKSLKRTHQKYYTTKNSKALPPLGKFFYEFYKGLGPAQTLVQNAESSGALKNIVIETFLTPEQQAKISGFTEEVIQERVKAKSAKEVADELKEELAQFFSFFDAEKVRLINGTYSFLQKFLNLIHFDYYFMIKKFDSNLPEGNFFYKPSFEPINGEYIADDLKDFLDVAIGLDKAINWELILDILKEYRGTDVVSRNGWKKMLRQLNNTVKSKVFELIVQHIENDPYYKPSPHNETHKIVEAYLAKLKTQAELTLQKLANAKRSRTIEDLCNKVFGTTSISRMKNYTEKANENFKKKMLGGYLYVQPLNYLKAFLIDHNKKDIRELVDLLLVRGKWTTNMLSQQLSDVFQQLVVLTDQLLEFDENLGEETSAGAKMKNMIIRSDKDQKISRMLRQLLKDINDRGKKLLFDVAQALIVLGKNVHQLLDDYSKTPHDIIINWKEVDVSTDNTIKQQLTDVYKKIYYFIKLLQFYNK